MKVCVKSDSFSSIISMSVGGGDIIRKHVYDEIHCVVFVCVCVRVHVFVCVCAYVCAQKYVLDIVLAFI